MELEGKVINFLGDSITEGIGVTNRLQNRFDNIIKRECGLRAVNNYGVGGSRIAYQSKPSENPRYDLYFCGRAITMDPHADIVVVYGGVNDYLHGDASMGAFGDKTPQTFYGGLYFLMDHLKKQYEGKTVIFVTPAHCNFYTGTDRAPSNHPYKPKDSYPLERYVAAIREMANYFELPVLDFYNDLGVDPNRPEDAEKYTTDGLHFNNNGHAVIAQKMKEFLSSL